VTKGWPFAVNSRRAAGTGPGAALHEDSVMSDSATQSSPPARVLVIDDAPGTVDLFTAFLSDAGYEVLSALNGADGLLLIDLERPDVVLLDLHMPGVPGFDVLRLVRLVRPDLPVIIVSGQADVNLARATLNRGAFEYISKPFDPENIIRTVAAALTNGPATGTARTA
jgi:DNA-binding NtrC family response regulator